MFEKKKRKIIRFREARNNDRYCQKWRKAKGFIMSGELVSSKEGES